MEFRQFLYVAIGDELYGYGHVSRGLAFAEHGLLRGDINISFLIFGSANSLNQTSINNYENTVRPLTDLTVENIEKFIGCLGDFDVIIFDISIPKLFSCKEELTGVIKVFNAIANRLVLIDGLGEQALTANASIDCLDIVIFPYVCDMQKEFNSLVLSGASYATLAPPYLNLAPRKVNYLARKVLVSCGGSDPTNLTLRVLESLNSIDVKLELRIIVGPLFSDSLKRSISEIVFNSPHSCVLVFSPKTLIDQMRWCDIAIATTGLIKYELAATSTPSVLISIDSIHYEINEPFSKCGTALNIQPDFTENQLKGAIFSLIEDYKMRLKMAILGAQLVDGKGCQKIIDQILRG
jgi:UDP-2,4-diacetamido-2,4,6-trideoxy-beta-L-altropyranose hydrolase